MDKNFQQLCKELLDLNKEIDKTEKNLFKLRQESVVDLRKVYARNYKVPKINLQARLNLPDAWLLPYLIKLDDMTWGRWEYWLELSLNPGLMPSHQIPQIAFLDDKATNKARKMLEACLNAINPDTYWVNWKTSNYFEYFINWLLYSLGDPMFPDPPNEPKGCEGASSRLYQLFCLDLLILYPKDYFGDLLAQMKYGKTLGFCPTPHDLSELTILSTFGEDVTKDLRTKKMEEAASGTGRLLLHASNYSLVLQGADISPLLSKCALLNGYFYAPWLAKPIWWIQKNPSIWAANIISRTGKFQNINANGVDSWNHFYAYLQLAQLKTDPIRHLSFNQGCELLKMGGVSCSP